MLADRVLHLQKTWSLLSMLSESLRGAKGRDTFLRSALHTLVPRNWCLVFVVKRLTGIFASSQFVRFTE
jgi:hypothetical protein